MSTRATYKFHQNHNTFVTYIHHDGYPEGAARYIKNWIEGIGDSGVPVARKWLVPEDFLRFNKKAELVKSHKFMSDTEYRYDFKVEAGKGWIVEVRKHSIGNSKNGKPIFLKIWEGTVQHFVFEHGYPDTGAVYTFPELK